jgi:3-oxoacyl-[acyl-carrier-protein] synthase II
MSRRRVAITGIGVVSPLGIGKESFWEGIAAGRSGVGTIANFDPTDFRVRIAAEVKGFDPVDFIDKKSARRMDRFAQYSVAAAKMAAEDAGFDPASDPEVTGAYIASGIGGVETFERETAVLIEKGPDRVSPLFIPMEIANMASAQVSIQLGIKGPTSTICTACTAGNNAIGEALEAIRRGAAEVMFAGGSEASVTPVGIAAFAAMRALSERNDEPERASRPFDRDRDGFVMGEGSAVLILEELKRAQARGARIYAELAGYGVSSDAYHISAPDPSGDAAARAMTLAIANAGIKPDEVDYINAHGTSTSIGDEIETRVIRKALGGHADAVAVSSTKSMTGHCLGAAGAIEAAASVLAIERSLIPPTINLENPDPECDLDYVPNRARKQRLSVAASNAFGFGGHNATLVFKTL